MLFLPVAVAPTVRIQDSSCVSMHDLIRNGQPGSLSDLILLQIVYVYYKQFVRFVMDSHMR